MTLKFQTVILRRCEDKSVPSISYENCYGEAEDNKPCEINLGNTDRERTRESERFGKGYYT